MKTTYLKSGNIHAGFVDPDTRQVIRRGEIVAVTKLTSTMNARIKKKGLIVCTEAEFLAQEAAKGKVTPPPPPAKDAPVKAPEVGETPTAPESDDAGGEKAPPEGDGEPAGGEEKAAKGKGKPGKRK